jgi:DNA replication protein DnaC
MERHEIIEAMTELKLYGMRANFDEITGKGLARRDELYPLIASLLRAERTHRQARSISYRIGGAKFPVLKDLDTFVFAETPVDEGQVRELATGAFLDAKRNTIFIGGTGTGKTHLCIAVASAIIRARARGRFFNLVDLVNQLEQEKAAGRSGRLAENLLRYDLIVIDELGYLPFSQPGGQLLFHLISKLYENTSLLITTNLAFAAELWAEVGDGLTGRRRRIVGVFAPPLLQQRSDTPCPMLTSSSCFNQDRFPVLPQFRCRSMNDAARIPIWVRSAFPSVTRPASTLAVIAGPVRVDG